MCMAIYDDRDLDEAKKNVEYWDDKVEDLAAEIRDLDEAMDNAQKERAYWTELIERYEEDVEAQAEMEEARKYGS